jgi:flavin-dependent dehydrogenase
MKQEVSSSSVSDVVICGGSAAGLFAAYLLARAGRHVRLFDANDVLHTESRTLITTSRLTDVLGFFPREAVCNEIKRIDLFSAHHAVSIPVQQPDLVVERSALSRLLARKAVEAGVEIRGHSKFIDVEPAPGGTAITVRDLRRQQIETFKAPIVIGADGTFSRIAKIADENGRETTPILQAIVKRAERGDANSTQVWFCPEDTPYFYWAIPESEDRAAVGFVTEEGRSARGKLEKFLARRGLKPLEIQAARIPVYTHWTRPSRKVAGAEIYLVGDAAAQVKVTTVGGLVTGLRGARAAVNAIVHRSDYLKELRPLRRELSLHLLLRSLLNGFVSQDYDCLLRLLNQTTIGLLGRYNRDHAARICWRLLLAQPRLLKLAGVAARAGLSRRRSERKQMAK